LSSLWWDLGKELGNPNTQLIILVDVEKIKHLSKVITSPNNNSKKDTTMFFVIAEKQTTIGNS
jgi:hypothetical protein